MTATWQAARNGLPSDSNAVNHANHVNQLLITHGVTPIYQGKQILTPAGNTTNPADDIQWWNLASQDIDQPFTLSGTTIGRVTLPLLAQGAGCDVVVSLCADSSGHPGTVLASTRIPASWIVQLSAAEYLEATSVSSITEQPTGNPLATARSTTLRTSHFTSTPLPSPALTASGQGYQASITSGNFIVLLGGLNSAGNAAVANVYSIEWLGGTTLGQVLPQPSLPQASTAGAVAVTSDTIMYAGGQQIGSPTTTYSSVWTASWNSATGTISAWSSQAALPVALYNIGAASWGETVYVVGGQNASNTVVNTVYYATVSNNQITGWSTGPPLPVALLNPVVEVVGNWLLVMGGGTGSSVPATIYYAAINADGSLGPWRTGPSMYDGVAAYPGTTATATSSGVVVISGADNSSTSPSVQTLTMTASGPGDWTHQTLPSLAQAQANPAAAFDLGSGQWQLFSVGSSDSYEPTSYWSALLQTVPVISVPLPVSGLTNGATYHILMQARGFDLNDSVFVAGQTSALPTSAQSRQPPGTGSWTSFTQSVFLSMVDQTATAPLRHLWEDSGARVTSLIYASATGQLLGVCEATQFADGTSLSSVAEITYTGLTPTGIVQLA